MKLPTWSVTPGVLAAGAAFLYVLSVQSPHYATEKVSTASAPILRVTPHGDKQEISSRGAAVVQKEPKQ